jgi:DNA mismatch repair protein MutL
MGFRGEALASIAAVSQVELRTKRKEDEVGTCITIENSIVLKQEPVAAADGTSIAMKNLFFNIPARRNFLKSNTAEMRHIVDEFIRVAMAFPELSFSLTSNGQVIFHLESGTLKQRIVQVLGNNYSAKLVSVKEETDYLNIYGFVGKPETAKKTRGEQYFFVNNRFIKSAYLNHALQSSYQNMIASDSYPMYVLFIDLDPAQVDVNVHPTKQEIKFEDEKIVYAFVQAAVKHSLAQFSITPALDFELDASIQKLDSVQKPFNEEKQAATQFSSIFQTFTQANQAHKIERSGTFDANNAGEREGFRSLGRYLTEQHHDVSLNSSPAANVYSSPDTLSKGKISQVFNTYLLLPLDDRLLLIHQQAAHERILYERLRTSAEGKPQLAQKSMFPVTLELAPADATLLMDLLGELAGFGYLVEPFGNNSFIIQGTPPDVFSGNEKQVIEQLLEQVKHSSDLKFNKREVLTRSLASQQAIKTGTLLSQHEMESLAESLFQCQIPNITPGGRPTYIELRKEQLEKMFR